MEFIQTPEEQKYLIDNEFDVDEFIIVPKKIASMARKHKGSKMAMGEIDDPDGVRKLGEGKAILFVDWAKRNGLYESAVANQKEQESQPDIFSQNLENIQKGVKQEDPNEVPPPPPSDAEDLPFLFDDSVSTYDDRLTFIRDLGFDWNDEKNAFVHKEGYLIDKRKVLSISKWGDFRAFVEESMQKPIVKNIEIKAEEITVKDVAEASPNVEVVTLPTEKEVEEINQEDLEEKAKKKKAEKKEKKKEDPPKPVENVVIAPENILEDLVFFKQLINGLHKAEIAMYKIEQIKAVVGNKSFDDESKLGQIKLILNEDNG